MTSPADRIAQARQRIREVSPEDVQHMQGDGAPTTILDVREPAEYATGHVPGATLLPLGTVADAAPGQFARDARIVAYCGSGNRSALAADTLQQLGYSNVTSMRGGIQAWADAGGEIEG